MDTTRIRELLDAKDKLDEELRTLVNGGETANGTKERKQVACSVCTETGHNARSCPKKQ